MAQEPRQFHATTVLCVRRDGVVALGGDGQVTLGDTVMKGNAVKIRRLADGAVLAGFAGAVADAFTLFDRFEARLKEHNNLLTRAAVELGREWRTDKYLRQLNALLAVCDRSTSLLISGTGEIIEPEDGILAIGSGGPTPWPPPARSSPRPPSPRLKWSPRPSASPPGSASTPTQT